MSRTRAALAKASGCCLVVLYLMSVFAFGLAGRAAAAESLNFLPLGGKYPYHLAGLGGATKLETLGGTQITAEKLDALAAILNSTLFDLSLQFLKTKAEGTEPCTNTSSSETVLLNLLGRLGFADPGVVPAVRLLVPSGFEFTCEVLGVKQKVKVKGAVIGTITKPALSTESEELTLLFNQTKSKQEYTTFLLGNETLTNQKEETAIGAGAFEQSGQQSAPTTLKASTGEGVFEIVGGGERVWWVGPQKLSTWGNKQRTLSAAEAVKPQEIRTKLYIIQCTKVASSGGFIGNAVEIESKFSFKGCFVTSDPELCNVLGKEVAFEASGSLLPTSRFEFVPEVPKFFATFTIEKEPKQVCPVEGTYGIFGKIPARLTRPEVQQATHNIQFEVDTPTKEKIENIGEVTEEEATIIGEIGGLKITEVAGQGGTEWYSKAP